MIKKIISVTLMVSVIAINFGFMANQTAEAAQLTVLSDTVTNLTASTVANHVIKFTTTTIIPTSGTVTLTFDNSTSLAASLDYTDVDIQDNGSDQTVAAAPGAAVWGVVRTSGLVLTLTNSTTTTVAAGHVIMVDIGTNAAFGVAGTHQITNGVAGSTVLRIAVSNGDVGAITMPIVANSVVAISAEVLPTLTFTISSNAIYFGNLKSSGTSCWAQNTNPGYVPCPTTTEQEAFNMTASTNGTSGYSISVQGDTLRSGATNTITALAASTAPAIGSEQFGLRINPSGGIGTVPALYGTAGQYAYTANLTTPVAVASAAAPSATTTYSVRYIANISTLTEAGSYTTAHTYIATGNF
jgi:hypothetical protein